MSKQIISTEAQILLKLLRLALGTEPRRYFGEPLEPSCGELAEPFPTNINWKEVIRLSYEHKVSALAVDGLKSSGCDIFKGLNEQQAIKLKPIVDNWFDDVAKTEQSYVYYHQVLNTLCQIFRANDLTPIILKGYGLSGNYPIPSHRGTGDMDIYLMDKDGNPAAEKGDEIVRTTLGIEVEDDAREHHSQFTFKGVLVENHYELFDPFYRCARFDSLVSELEIELKAQSANDGALTIFPNATFNAIYLLMHLYNHFYFSYYNIRQLLDYALFVKKHGNEVDWNRVNNIINGAQLQEFQSAVNLIVSYLLESKGADKELDPLPQYMLNDLFNPHQTASDNSIKGKLTGYYKNRLRLKHIYHRNWLTLTCGRIMNFVLRKPLFDISIYSNLNKLHL